MYPGNVQVIGSCSLCGGRVVLPIVWWGVIPPTPTCETCGAVRDDRGLVIPMRPAGQRITYSVGSATQHFIGALLIVLALVSTASAGSSELLPAGTGPVPNPSEDQLAPRADSPGAAASITLRAFSTLDGEAAFAFGASPIGLTFTASTDEWLGARITLDAGSQLAPVLHALAIVDIYGMTPRGYSWELAQGWYWRGAVSAELGGLLTGHDGTSATILARFASWPSAQLWESTSRGDTSPAADWGYMLGGGFRVTARPDPDVSIRFAMIYGLDIAQGKATGALHELALSVAGQFEPGWWLVGGFEGTPLAGPRASPIDLRSVALVRRLFVGIEWRP